MIVFAINIHTGGGKILLDELIQSEPFGEITHLFLDARYHNPSIPDRIVIKRYPPKIIDRFQAQKDLKTLFSDNPQSPQGPVLLFGNYPPVFKLPVPAILYLQNCFLLAGVPLPKGNLLETLRNWCERKLLKIFRKNFDQVWVQSEWMVNLTHANFPEKVIVKKPFLPRLPAPQDLPKVFDLLTVSSLSKHKNFDIFLQALVLLDRSCDRKLSVLVVLDSKLDTSQMNIPILKNIKITIKSRVSREELFDYYQKSKLAVITSSFESFCLPLHEALHFSLQVICLQASYLEDVHSKVVFYRENKPEVLFNTLRRVLTVR